LGWKGPQEIPAQPPAQSRSALGSDQVAQGLIQLVLQTSKNGAGTTTLGKLCRCLSVLMQNRFSLPSAQTSLVSVCCHLSPCSLPMLRKAWVHIPSKFTGRGWMMQGGRSLPCPRQTQPHSRGLSSQGKCSSTSHPGGLPHLAPVWQRLSHTRSPKSDTVSGCDLTSAGQKEFISPLISWPCPCFWHPGCGPQGLPRGGGSTKQGTWYGAELCTCTTLLPWRGNLLRAMPWQAGSLCLKNIRWPSITSLKSASTLHCREDL